ncbi:MAG: helix-hairpin-helix domain-containing protein, partial [Lachnospiraceae bacterium]|nr:helix-hairpin-helix domain-containing protein [Lachnospiraceae bacterium]
QEDLSEITSDNKQSVSSDEASLIYIYICGEVQVPGVYTLKEGSRVYDAIWAAGGFTKQAATDYWNQAMILTDSDMIYVPTKEEAKDRTPLSSSTLENQNLDFNQNNKTDTETGSTTGHKININTASKEELMEIPGVGESKALSILAYRKEHGAFSTVEEIKEVSGIKDGVFQKMKEYIVAD